MIPSILDALFLALRICAAGAFLSVWLYLAIPTIFRQFDTSNLWLAWLSLVFAVAIGVDSFDRFGLWSLAVYTLAIVIASAWIHQSLERLRNDPPEKITVVFFWKEPPPYGKNLW